MDITAHLDPAVPGPRDSPAIDADGWGTIDLLGAWDCTLSEFKGIEEVPFQHREIWAQAVGIVMQRIHEAPAEGPELDRALKWWLALPQMLLGSRRWPCSV